ncbi:hypothetical protein M405DRAFT_937676 [Rhizopogon salebrosus TDB-379]|nr:hypothetical protein M405DRAFT_937676 [Rhizopogon salebrosus TDB-379]
MSRMVYPPPGLPPPKVKKTESDNRGTASFTFDQLLDAPITIPLHDLVAPCSKQVLPGEDLRIVEPHQQATMTMKIEHSLPRQESQSRVPVAVFTLSQVPRESLSHTEEDLAKSQPEVPVTKSPEVQPSTTASKLRPKPAKTKIEVTPVSPSSSQNQVPHISSALVPLVSNIDRTPAPFTTRTNSFISLCSLQFVYSIISTLPTLVLPLVPLLSSLCFAKSPSHRTH